MEESEKLHLHGQIFDPAGQAVGVREGERDQAASLVGGIWTLVGR